jgi:hypothetical protein
MGAKPGLGPLCYLVLEDTLNTWQLGRLIYRMHRAGTARVAAMMHFDQIQRADEILSRVEYKLEKSLDSSRELAEPDEELENQARAALRVSNREVEIELRKIAALDLDGSLDYRIERSRYYVSQFNRITKSLRIKRVHGFQTYVEFVQQRLGPVFEYIDRIGSRHARVQSDRGLLLRRLMSLEALYEERFISRTQRVADGALYGILGPYYLISIVDHAHWPISDYLWRIGVVYSFLYLGLLAWQPKQPKPKSSGGFLARLRSATPRRVRFRLLSALVTSVLLVTYLRMAGPPVAEIFARYQWLRLLQSPPAVGAAPGSVEAQSSNGRQAAIAAAVSPAASASARSSSTRRQGTSSPRPAL